MADDSLSPFAAAFLACLANAHPGISQEGELIPHDTDSGYGIRIVVPPPPGGSDPLEIEVADNEVSLVLGLAHTYYDVNPYDCATLDDVIPQAVKAIVGLFDEDIVVMLGANDEDACAASAFKPRARTDWTFDDMGLRTCFRSWRGTYDKGWCLPWDLWE